MLEEKKLFVHIKQITFMQRITERAKDGYLYYVEGECAADKAENLFQKFRRIYAVDLQKDERYRTRKAGNAVFSMICYQLNSDENAPVQFVLMRTAGKMPALAEKESWKDIGGKTPVRLLLFKKYELVTHPRKVLKKKKTPVQPGQATTPPPVKTKKPKDLISWTFRFSLKKNEELRSLIITAIRTRDEFGLKQVLADVQTAPGFAKIREQIYSMYQLVVSEWKRSRGDSEPLPELPGAVPFARKIKSKTRQVDSPKKPRKAHGATHTPAGRKKGA